MNTIPTETVEPIVFEKDVHVPAELIEHVSLDTKELVIIPAEIKNDEETK